MAYCRRVPGVSDVYMIQTVGSPTDAEPMPLGPIVCLDCSLGESIQMLRFSTALEALAHLHDHVDALDRVSLYALERLRSEIA